MGQRIFCYESAAWAEQVAAQIAARLRAALAARRQATILLAGGSTPEPVYRALARMERIEWRRVHFFWGDERPVPPDDPDSNFGMARAALLEPLGLTSESPTVHRFPTEATTARANAAMYEQNLRLFFGLTPGEWPRFDVALLGMGEDGHTASLFPGTAALHEREHLAVANEVPDEGTTRLTVTFPLLNAARCLLVLVRGAAKAALVAEVLAGSASGYPIQQVQPTEGDVLWLLDEEAASQLPAGSCE